MGTSPPESEGASLPPGLVTTSRWQPGLADAGAEPRQVDAICGVARDD